jgi:heptosyltransferase-1
MTASPRILITRLTALGDTVHGLPVACALRERYPDAFLAWVVEGSCVELLRGHSALDQVIPLPRRWWRSLAEIRKARTQIRELEFDISVDLQGLTKSASLAWLAGIPRRLGAAPPHGREISPWLNNQLVHCNATHVIDHYLQILQPLGIDEPEVRFDLPLRPGDENYADRILAGLGLQNRGFALLNPGAGWPSKLWPAERYGELAIHLHKQHGLPSIALWGVDQELPDAEIIVSTSRGSAHLAPPTTIGQLIALTRRARVFVGSDTGPLHLAVAVGTPSLSLHGTSQASWCGAYGPTNLTLQAYYADGSARQRRAMDNVAMQAITTDMAIEACDRLLAMRPLAKAS